MRHGVPATLTSRGRVIQSWIPGPADNMKGAARWAEVFRRLHRSHGWLSAAFLTVAAFRHGVTLSGGQSE